MHAITTAIAMKSDWLLLLELVQLTQTTLNCMDQHCVQQCMIVYAGVQDMQFTIYGVAAICGYSVFKFVFNLLHTFVIPSLLRMIRQERLPLICLKV